MIYFKEKSINMLKITYSVYITAKILFDTPLLLFGKFTDVHVWLSFSNGVFVKSFFKKSAELSSSQFENGKK